MSRISILLNAKEFQALVAAAESHYRHPREEARFMLRQELERGGFLHGQIKPKGRETSENGVD